MRRCYFSSMGAPGKAETVSSYSQLGNRVRSGKGFVTVVPSYRLAPKHPHPAQIEDVAKRPFAWTVRHVFRIWRRQRNRIYVAGHSAGGASGCSFWLWTSDKLARYQLFRPKAIHGVLGAQWRVQSEPRTKPGLGFRHRPARAGKGCLPSLSYQTGSARHSWSPIVNGIISVFRRQAREFSIALCSKPEFNLILVYIPRENNHIL